MELMGGRGEIIQKNTVRQRLKLGSTNGHGGQTTPMSAVDPYLVELLIQLANMRTPITSTQGLVLANSLISVTKIENWPSGGAQGFLPQDHGFNPTQYVLVTQSL